MFTILADVAVLAIVGFCAKLGYDRGLRPATVAALELFGALAAALLLAPSVAGILTPALAGVAGRDFDSAPWAMLVATALLYGVAVAVLLTVVPKRLVFKVDDDDSFDDEPPGRPEGRGGAVMGGTAGLLTVGTVLVLVSMVPWPPESRFRPTSMLYDVGAFCLRAFGHVADWGHGGRSVVVYGEPLSEKSVPEARLSSESYADLDGDGKYGHGDLLYDADASGVQTADLYYLDLDEDQTRRTGMLEHYVIGTWGVIPTVLDRERPGAAPPPRPEEEEESPPPPPRQPPPPKPPAKEQAGEPEDEPPVPVKPPPVPGPPKPKPAAPPPPPGDDF